MKKLLKYFKMVNIDVLVYSMKTPVDMAFPEMKFTLESEKLPDGKMRFFINDNGKFVHQSFLYPKLHLLRLLGKTGPAIGNCSTANDYRGQSIYPFVINHIASGLLKDKKAGEVFIIVNTGNTTSVRGIEKAGFSLHSKIKAKRFLLFYFDENIVKT